MPPDKKLKDNTIDELFDLINVTLQFNDNADGFRRILMYQNMIIIKLLDTIAKKS